MEIHELAAGFPDGSGYLNSATMGLPSLAAVAALRRHLDEWEAGTSDPKAFDLEVDRSRRAFGALVQCTADRVGILSQVSVATGIVASSLPDGARVLAAEEDFTSVLFPFLADPRLQVRLVPLDQLIDQITSEVDLVAVSAVQSGDGRRLDLDALAEAAEHAGVRTFVDITQAAGWMELDASRFDVTACGAYKWLCCPRGAAFITVDPSAMDWLVPRYAGWYAGDDPWISIYGPPLRLAVDARRFDASPAWFAWSGAAPVLESLAAAGTTALEAHGVGLANALRQRLDLEPSDSAIVSLDLVDGATTLQRAGITCAGRAGRVRLGFHLYNTMDDVEAVVTALDG